MDKDPFGYPILTYLWVIGLASFASIVRHLNNMSEFVLGRILIDALSGGFTGLLTFWLCEWSGIRGPLSAFLISVSGLMGARVWQEFLFIWRAKFNIPLDAPLDQESAGSSYHPRPRPPPRLPNRPKQPLEEMDYDTPKNPDL